MKPLIAILAFIGVAFAVIVAAIGQQGKSAAPNDQTAKSLIDMERQWAEASCTHSVIVQDILADDFQGTSPDGKRYSKAEAVEEAKTSKDEAGDCHLDDAKVRFLGLIPFSTLHLRVRRKQRSCRFRCTLDSSCSRTSRGAWVQAAPASTSSSLPRT